MWTHGALSKPREAESDVALPRSHAGCNDREGLICQATTNKPTFAEQASRAAPSQT